MNNSALQQSLVELEENLKNLESARTQVENVSGKVEQVTLAFTKILMQIELLQKEFSKEQGYFKEIIDKSIGEFNLSLIENKNDIEKTTYTLTNRITDSISDTVNKLESLQKNIYEATERISKFDFEKSIKEVKTVVVKIEEQLSLINQNFTENKNEIAIMIQAQNKTAKKQLIIILVVIAIGFTAVISLISTI